MGIAGQGADEYMLSKYCEPVPQDDVLAFAKAVERSLQLFEQEPHIVEEKTRKFSSFLSERYSLEQERHSVVKIWTSLLTPLGITSG